MDGGGVGAWPTGKGSGPGRERYGGAAGHLGLEERGGWGEAVPGGAGQPIMVRFADTDKRAAWAGGRAERPDGTVSLKERRGYGGESPAMKVGTWRGRRRGAAKSAPLS